MQTKWNQFVYLLCEAKKKNVEESDYHSLIEQQLQLLGWFLFNGEICHKPSIHIGNSNHIQPDILIKKDGEEEFVIEVKRPSHKFVKKDVEQLQSYMRQLKLSVGIYIGEHIEVFYDMAGSKDAVSVLRIHLELNNKEGALFIDQFSKDGYDRARVLSFCKQRIDEMQHQSDLNKLRDDIIAHPKSRIGVAMLYYLSSQHKDQFSEEELTNMLHDIDFSATLKSAPVLGNPALATAASSGSSHHTDGNVWLICYDSKYFKVEECFKKYGQIYWTHKAGLQNVQQGDTAYLYAARPESAVRFKVEVVASQLPYSKEMDVEDEFVATGRSNSDDSDKTYFLVRPLAETHSPALKHDALMSMGLMGKRPSTTKLSKDGYKALREYIEQHFDEAAAAEVPAPQKKAKSKKQEKPNAKSDRRPPFKFSMIGLKPGDTIVFAPNGEEVRVNSENTVDYDGQILTLSRFCKIYMPDSDSENREYQGPAHFIYKGKTLDEIRKEKERKTSGGHGVPTRRNGQYLKEVSGTK